MFVSRHSIRNDGFICNWCHSFWSDRIYKSFVGKETSRIVRPFVSFHWRCSWVLPRFTRVNQITTTCGVDRLEVELQELDHMHKHESPVSEDTVYSILQQCMRKKDSVAIKELHSLIISNNLESVTILGDHLIRAFASCHNLLEANLVFCKVLNPSVYTWLAIISAYVNHGENSRALDLYYKMQQQGVSPNAFVYACILKSCANGVDLQQGRLIHDQIINSEYELNVIIGSTLIDMYAKCGSLEDAHKVFDNLPSRNVVSWGAMLTGYIQHADGSTALELLKQMQEEGIQPDKVMQLCILKACSCTGELEQGKITHDELVRSEWELGVVIGSAVIDMYVKCGALYEAQKVFDNLPHQSVVSWAALISGYIQQGDDHSALELFVEMQSHKVIPDKVIYLCSLKACSNTGDSKLAKCIHDALVRNKLEADVAVANTLVDMYCKCGWLQEAQKLFGMLQARDSVSWAVLMAGFVQHGLSQVALECFERVHLEEIEPDEVIFMCSLKACSSIGALALGKLIHIEVLSKTMECNLVIGTALIDMYAKCGGLKESQNVFDKLSNKNAAAWGAMIAGYTEQGESILALKVFDEMLRTGIPPTKSMCQCIAKACGNAGYLMQGKLLHHLTINGGFETDTAIGSALIDMYLKCERLSDAHRVFDRLPNQSVIVWAVMVAGYAEHGHDSIAFELFNQMQNQGVKPDKVIFLCMLKACATREEMNKSRLLHDQIVRDGLDSDVTVGNALIDTYAKCGSLEEAEKLFDRLQNRDFVSWGSIITAYAQIGHIFPAIQCLQKMQQEGLKPNEVTHLCILGACCCETDLDAGKLIHYDIIKNGLGFDRVIGSALIDMYAKCGSLEDAYHVFDSLPSHDVVSWSAMLTGCVQQGRDLSALNFFGRMQRQGIKPNTATFLCILKACGSIGALAQGQMIHHLFIESEDGLDLHVGNALVDMYAKCGSFNDGGKVFSSLSERDLISWGAMIAGYAHHGLSGCVKQCYETMQHQGLRPGDMTYSSILVACSHSGQVETGHEYINFMRGSHEILPNTDHFNCMVDLFGRAGLLKEAERILLSMPETSDLTGWVSLLSACKTYGDMEVGKRSFERIVLVDPDFGAGYALMSSIYAGAQMWGEVSEVHELRKCTGAWKKPGQARVEVADNLHEFFVAEQGHSHSDKVYACLNNLSRGIRKWGYVPHLDVMSKPMYEDMGTLFSEKYENVCLDSKNPLTSGSTTLVDMFCKCGLLAESQAVFDSLPVHNVGLWTALISRYTEHGLSGKVLNSSKPMHLGRVSADAITSVLWLKACSNFGAYRVCQELHAEVIKIGLEADLYIGSMLIDTYSKFGLFAEVCQVFDKLPVKNAVPWNILIAVYSEHGLGEEAVSCFKKKWLKGVLLDANMVVCRRCVLQHGFLRTGRWNDAKIIYVFDPGGPLCMNACGTKGMAKYVMLFW